MSFAPQIPRFHFYIFFLVVERHSSGNSVQYLPRHDSQDPQQLPQLDPQHLPDQDRPQHLDRPLAEQDPANTKPTDEIIIGVV